MIHKSRMGKRMMAMLLCGTLTFTSVVPAIASELPETETAVQSAVTEEESAVETSVPEETSAVAESQDGGVKQDVDAVDQPTDETKEETAAADKIADADSDTSNAIPESQDPQEEAQQSDVAELALDGEGDAALFADDEDEAIDLSIGSNTVKIVPEETDTYSLYKFTPSTSGRYIFYDFSMDLSVCNYDTKEEVSYWGMELEANKTYYFYFIHYEADTGELEGTISLMKGKTFNADKTIVEMEDTFCELAASDYYVPTGVSCTLYYDGEPQEGVFDEDELIIRGYYMDDYIFRLKDENGKVYDYYTSLPAGTYTLWLYRKYNRKEIKEVPNYKVVVKDISDIDTKDLTFDTTKVDLSDSRHNSYTYYKYEATAGDYYLSTLSHYSVYYYDDKTQERKKVDVSPTGAFSLEDKTYYFVFYQDYDSDNALPQDEITFGCKKKIDKVDVSAEKSSYLAYIEYPLKDWEITFTYDDGNDSITYALLDLYEDCTYDDDGVTITDTYLEDGSGNKINYSITGSDNQKVTLNQWLKPGTYEVIFGDNTAKSITITKPQMSDWEGHNKVIKEGQNEVTNSYPGVDRCEYYLFKPESDGQYVFTHSIDAEMWQDDLLYYNEATGTMQYIEDGNVDYYEDHFVLNAKASENYLFEATCMFSCDSRVLTITKKESEEHTHTYVSSVTKVPTCTVAGVRTYTCTAGDDSYTEAIPATGHRLTTLPAKAATCTATGLTEGQKCSVCGTVTVAQKSIPATGHKLTTLPAKAATCTATGLTEGKQCTACGTITVPQQTTPALGHAMGGWVTTQAPTALADGMQSRTCSRCGYAETAAIARLAATGFLNATNVPLKVKQSATLTVRDMAAGDYVASWNTSNAKVVTVNNGKLTGKKKGTATVTATLASGRVLTATVKVQTGNVKTTGIVVNTRQIALVQGDVFQLVSSITPFTSKDKLSYKTSNKKVATVSKNGKITAKKAGKATITVKAGKKSVKVKVTVVGVKTTDIRVNTTQLNLKVKKKATIKTYLTPKNTSEKVTYKTSNKKIATVDKKGKVTAKKAGTATITVKSGSKSVKVNVTVTK